MELANAYLAFNRNLGYKNAPKFDSETIASGETAENESTQTETNMKEEF